MRVFASLNELSRHAAVSRNVGTSRALQEFEG
jgi:hypothetical protein